MTDGIRITQAGSTTARVTQSGHRRITERASLMGASMTAAPVMLAVQCARRRSIGASMTATTTLAASLRGKVTACATLLAAGSMGASGLRARRTFGAQISTATQFYPGTGRVRTLCLHLNSQADIEPNLARQRPASSAMRTAPSVQFAVIKNTRASLALAAGASIQVGAAAPLQRQRSVSAALSTAPGLSPILLRKTARLTTHLTAAPTATFGRDEIGDYRILEDGQGDQGGQGRVTEAGNRRLIEESFTWGNLVVVHPPFKIFNNRSGLWYVLTPSAKHEGAWQLPQAIRVQWQGGWRDVKSNK